MKSVVVVLVALSVSWFVFVQVCISSRYGWTIVCAMSGFVCVVSIVMSSAYVTILMCGDWGVGRSDVYRLKSVGDSTPPCGTPVLVMRCFDVVLLYVVYCLRPFM